jgi:RNA polymerase sigma factor (sigma-70 family)
MEKATIKNDQALIKMYQNGDSFAFGLLFEHYYQTIWSSIFIIVKDSMLTDDILQDTFLKAMISIKAGNYEEKGVFKFWLLKIAHNLSIDHVRKGRKTPISFSIYELGGKSKGNDENSSFSVIDDEKNIEEKIIEKEGSKTYHMEDLIKDLLPEQKELIILRMIHGYSFREIASYTQVPINTALGRMRYSLLKLRKKMKDL